MTKKTIKNEIAKILEDHKTNHDIIMWYMSRHYIDTLRKFRAKYKKIYVSKKYYGYKPDGAYMRTLDRHFVKWIIKNYG